LSSANYGEEDELSEEQALTAQTIDKYGDGTPTNPPARAPRHRRAHRRGMMARRARAGIRVKLVEEWHHIPAGTVGTLGEKYRSEVGLLRINIRFDDSPDLPFTLSRPEVDGTIITLKGESLVL
jgi:hypothetical protein